MVNVVTGLTKYALILFLAIYTLLGFRMAGKSEEEKEAALWQQNILFFGMHFLGNLVLYLNHEGRKPDHILRSAAGIVFSVFNSASSDLSEGRQDSES